MARSFYITTAIPYVNGDPHIGHALELVQSDILARYHRLVGRELFWGWGTDENSLKNVQAAEAEGIPVADLVRRNADKFYSLRDKNKLNLSFDDFIRTGSDPRHLPGAQKLWLACASRGDIYKKKYRGFYCVGCEDFKTEKELVNGQCPEHPGEKVSVVEEENYFFKLSRYQKELEGLISSGRLQVIPETRKNEMLSFIRQGLEDFSISRSVERAHGWGIPVPGDSSQIQYVWFDANSNYINLLGYADEAELYQKFWVSSDERVHVIGKGITRFHAIYWPATLLSAGLPLPTVVFVHGYVTVGGKKMSKSLGNIVDPFALISEFGTDAVRYFLAREISTFEDGDFTPERFHEAYNANLANGLGNLASRIMKMSEDNLSQAPEIPEGTMPQEFKDLLEAYRIDKACDFIWRKISELDLRIQKEEPFKLIKQDKTKALEVIRGLVVNLAAIARMLDPILPATSKIIKDSIKANRKPEPLFVRK